MYGLHSFQDFVQQYSLHVFRGERMVLSAHFSRKSVQYKLGTNSRQYESGHVFRGEVGIEIKEKNSIEGFKF